MIWATPVEGETERGHAKDQIIQIKNTSSHIFDTSDGLNVREKQFWTYSSRWVTNDVDMIVCNLLNVLIEKEISCGTTFTNFQHSDKNDIYRVRT